MANATQTPSETSRRGRGRPAGKLNPAPAPAGSVPIKTLIALPIDAHRRGRALAQLMGVPLSVVFEAAINKYFHEEMPVLTRKESAA